MSASEDKIRKLIKDGEGISTEFKRTISSPLRIARVVVSFANTSGGTLLIGVEDNGTITGISSELEEIEKLEQACQYFMSDELHLSYGIVELEGKTVMEVRIKESEHKPVSVVNQKGERITYVRVKDKAVPAGRLTLSAGIPQDLVALKEVKQIRTLFLYLKDHDHVTARDFSRMINFSERRATSLLNDLVQSGYLLARFSSGKQLYSLRIVSTV